MKTKETGKRILLIALAIAMLGCLVLTGCGSKEAEPDTVQSTPAVTEDQKAEEVKSGYSELDVAKYTSFIVVGGYPIGYFDESGLAYEAGKLVEEQDGTSMSDKDAVKENIVSKLEISCSPSENISAGDTIKITVTGDSKFLDRYHLALTNSEIEVYAEESSVIEGIPETADFYNSIGDMLVVEDSILDLDFTQESTLDTWEGWSFNDYTTDNVSNLKIESIEYSYVEGKTNPLSARAVITYSFDYNGTNTFYSSYYDDDGRYIETKVTQTTSYHPTAIMEAAYSSKNGDEGWHEICSFRTKPNADTDITEETVITNIMS